MLLNKKTLLAFFMLLLGLSIKAQETILVNYGSSWSYYASGSLDNQSWRESSYNSSAWNIGNAPLGYNASGLRTTLPSKINNKQLVTAYYRKTITISDNSLWEGYRIKVKRDDGLAFYVNGKHVNLIGENLSSTNPLYATYADGNSGYDVEYETLLPVSLFKKGENTLAVEVHQYGSGSTDLYFDMSITAVKKEIVDPNNPNIVNFGSSWSYYASGSLDNQSWRETSYNSLSWNVGNAPLGYNATGLRTTLPSKINNKQLITAYYRKTIAIVDNSLWEGYRIKVKRDDGLAFYVNGKRVNLIGENLSSTNPLYATYADGNSGYDMEYETLLSASLFKTGENTLAVEVHQYGSGSTDLYFDMSITAVKEIVNKVIYKWSGALQHSSIKVNAKLEFATSNARLVVSKYENLSAPIFSNYIAVNTETNNMGSFTINGLAENTKYYYSIESYGSIDKRPEAIGSFKTPSSRGFSYHFTVGSCSENGNHVVWNNMGQRAPLFMMVTGDFHYWDPNSTNIETHRKPYEQEILAKDASRRLFNFTPLAYIWDDHDFSGNDSKASSIGASSAKRAYREYVPHYDFGTQNYGPIYQSYIIGRVYYIMTDLHSEMTSSQVMSSSQEEWFKRECIKARDNNYLICWVSTFALNSTESGGWATNSSYRAQRERLGNFFKNERIQNMFIISGDTHALGIDNGYNNDFSTYKNNSNKYPVLHAAALNRAGSTKGVKCSEFGPLPNPDKSYGQYGVVDVVDNGLNEIAIRFSCVQTDSRGYERVLKTYEFTKNLGSRSTRIGNTQSDQSRLLIESVYPNPARGIVNVKVISDETIQYTLTSLGSARVVKRGSISKQNNTIDCSNLSAGTYVLTVKSKPGVTEQEKIVILD